MDVTCVMDQSECRTESALARGQGEHRDPTELLCDSARVPSDVRMIARAIREGWQISPEMREKLKQRMAEIVNKSTVAIPTKDGTFDSDYHADGNAIKAGALLVAMNGQDQGDDHLAEKYRRIDAGLATDSHDLKLYGKDAPTDAV